MTRQECIERLQREQAKLLPMKEELTRAKSMASQSGVYMDASAYAALERKVRAQGQLCQRLQTELSRLNKIEPHTLPQRFMNAAERRLKPGVFEAILEEARENRVLAWE